MDGDRTTSSCFDWNVAISWLGSGSLWHHFNWAPPPSNQTEKHKKKTRCSVHVLVYHLKIVWRRNSSFRASLLWIWPKIFFFFTEASGVALNVLLSTLYNTGKEAECVRPLTNDTQSKIPSLWVFVYQVWMHVSSFTLRSVPPQCMRFSLHISPVVDHFTCSFPDGLLNQMLPALPLQPILSFSKVTSLCLEGRTVTAAPVTHSHFPAYSATWAERWPLSSLNVNEVIESAVISQREQEL